MSTEKDFIALIGLIYEAALDSDLWPSVLTRIADAVGVAQVAMPSFDWRANVFTTIAPRFDPDLLISYKEYWAFREPIVPRAMKRPVGEIYSLDGLIPREEFAATPVFNEWWRRAECGLAAMGANLVREDRFSALICLFNAPGKDAVTSEQARLFQALLPHLTRALRINRRFWNLELEHLIDAERLETLQTGALLADASARVVAANTAAKVMLDHGRELFLDKGRLAAAGGPDVLQRMIASCARSALASDGPGGEINIPREHPRSALSVTVAPLRSKTQIMDVPWIGLGAPVALVMVSDPDCDRQRREDKLRHRFGLTAAESGLAAEILRGDGRVAAARRRGISAATAKTHLSNIFLKTGTHRQAELVRLLLDAADEREI